MRCKITRLSAPLKLCRAPVCALNFAVCSDQVDRAFKRVSVDDDLYRVAFFDSPDRSSGESLRSYVADARASRDT